MSLFKQLWLAVAILLALVFGGSFVISSLSAKSYLEQQLYLKNADNAAALALSLTQQQADPVLLELVLSAQFDTGHYQRIELVDPEGQVLVRREDRDTGSAAPAWFMSLLPIEVAPGVAQVQRGWEQVGTLTVESHSRFAYRELWQSTWQLALTFLAALLIAGLVGSWLLRRILRPLDDVVHQAEEIGRRRFVTLPEPRARELRRVVGAMNTLSERVRQALRQETARLEKWQRDSQLDRVTGLLSREAFLRNLEAMMEEDDVNASGVVVLLRLVDLSTLNRDYGSKVVDGLLNEVGTALATLTSGHSRWCAARLNGSDFALAAPRAADPRSTAREFRDLVAEVMESHSLQEEVQLPCAATLYSHSDTLSTLLTRLDGSLASALEEQNREICVTYAGDVQMMPVREQLAHWKSVLETAFVEQRINLASFPVINSRGELLHYEAPARLMTDDGMLAAGAFLPWINRLGLSAELDRHVVDLALRLIQVRGKALAVNLSVASLVDPGFPLWLSDRLSAAGEGATLLWMEFPESMAFRHLESFKRLCIRATSLGCQVGIEHVGHQLGDLGRLHDVGLDYLKVDTSFVKEIDRNHANQTLLRTLCTIGHSMGVLVIAEGVKTNEEWEELERLGVDGATGPAVTDSERD